MGLPDLIDSHSEDQFGRLRLIDVRRVLGVALGLSQHLIDRLTCLVS